MRLRFSIVLLAIFSTISLFGQELDQEYGIYHTYSGSKYIGKIVNETDQEITLQLNDGNQVKIGAYNLRSYLPPEEVLIFKKGKYHLTRGFFVNLTIAGGLSDEEDSAASHSGLRGGYYLNKNWTVGGGISADFNEGTFNGLNIDTQVRSYYAFGRYYLTHSRNRFFIYGKIGYGFGVDDNLEGEADGGLMYHGGAGLHFGSIGKTKFLLKLGANFQNAQGKQIDIDPFGNEIVSKYDVLFKKLMIGFALDFTTRKKD